MKRVLISLLVLCMCCTTPVWMSRVNAEEQVNGVENTEGGAKEASSYEDLLYMLRFVELDEQLTQNLIGSFSIDQGKEDYTFRLISDPNLLQVLGTYAKSFTASLLVEERLKKTASDDRSWMVTTYGEPTQIRIEEQNLCAVAPAGLQEQPNQNTYLDLKLTPEKWVEESDQVLTRFELHFQQRTGEAGDIDLTTWITESEEEPVALISKKVQEDGRSEEKYFALYLTVRRVNASQTANSSSMMGMGNLDGLQKFFFTPQGLEEEKEPHQLFIVLNQNLWQVGGEFYFDRFSTSATFKKAGEEIGYTSRWNLPFFEELNLSTMIGNRKVGEVTPELWLGFADQNRLFEDWQVETVFYPMQFDFQTGKFVYFPYAELEVEYQQPRWSLTYQGKYGAEGVEQQVGLGYQIGSCWELQGFYLVQADREQQVLVGLSFELPRSQSVPGSEPRKEEIESVELKQNPEQGSIINPVEEETQSEPANMDEANQKVETPEQEIVVSEPGLEEKPEVVEDHQVANETTGFEPAQKQYLEINLQEKTALLNGEKVTLPPFILLYGKVWAPVRAVAEIFDGDVYWDYEAQTITIVIADRNIYIEVPEEMVLVNGTIYQLKDYLLMYEDYTFITIDDLPVMGLEGAVEGNIIRITPIQ